MSDTYDKKLSKLLTVVRNTTDIRARSDLYKVYKNCRNLHTDLSKASVECRRLGRETAEYQAIRAKLDESINTFEQWVTFAALLYA